MPILLIVKLVEIALDALDYVAAIALQDVVEIKHTLYLFILSESGCSFWNRPFDNHGAFIRQTIGLPVCFIDFIRVFFGHATALRCRDSGIRVISA